MSMRHELRQTGRPARVDDQAAAVETERPPPSNVLKPLDVLERFHLGEREHGNRLVDASGILSGLDDASERYGLGLGHQMGVGRSRVSVTEEEDS
jgi:hypothetical protein